MILKYHVIKKTFFYTLLYYLCIVNAQSNRLFWDGRDWNRVSKTVDYNTENTIRVKKAYLDGVLDGRLYGYLRTWAVDKKIADEVFSETVDYLNTRELIKSIDNFYEDPINGYIPVASAVTLRYLLATKLPGVPVSSMKDPAPALTSAYSIPVPSAVTLKYLLAVNEDGVSDRLLNELGT